MMKKRKIWKSIGAIILLLMFHVDATATDYPFDGVTITINDGIAKSASVPVKPYLMV